MRQLIKEAPEVTLETVVALIDVLKPLLRWSWTVRLARSTRPFDRPELAQEMRMVIS